METNVNTQAEYIAEQMKKYARDIDTYSVGDELLNEDGMTCRVNDKSINSLEVWIPKESEHGVDSTQWIPMSDFLKKYKRK